jgi:PAS domain S-box-containing protein
MIVRCTQRACPRAESQEVRVEDGSREAVMWRNRALTLFDRVTVPVAVCDVHGDVLLANPAMAAECGTTPGRLRGRDVLELFRPQEAGQVERIAEALRLRHRSRYEVSVRWEAPGGAERFGELTADPVSDTVQAAKETGLTTDGVTYHLRRLSARWGAPNRTELVARAYALGVLTPGVWPPGA